jgi:hypothetical protein
MTTLPDNSVRIVTAADIAGALHGRRSERGWMAYCPAHEADGRHHNRSLSVSERNGRVLVYCFGGCGQAEVIAALRARGLWPEQEHKPLSRADRQAWADSQRIREEAEHFAEAAAIMAEWALEELADSDPGRYTYTRLLMALRISPEAEYREWLDRDRAWASALVAAGGARDRRLQVSLAEWIATGMPAVSHG